MLNKQVEGVVSDRCPSCWLPTESYVLLSKRPAECNHPDRRFGAPTRRVMTSDKSEHRWLAIVAHAGGRAGRSMTS